MIVPSRRSWSAASWAGVRGFFALFLSVAVVVVGLDDLMSWWFLLIEVVSLGEAVPGRFLNLSCEIEIMATGSFVATVGPMLVIGAIMGVLLSDMLLFDAMLSDALLSDVFWSLPW